jgi:hypothetical protein
MMERMNFFSSDKLNTAVFTTRYILCDKKPILRVYHHNEDGAWEFLGNENHHDEDYRIISLGEIITIDPTVLDLSYMQFGYYAEREKQEKEWEIRIIARNRSHSNSMEYANSISNGISYFIP